MRVSTIALTSTFLASLMSLLAPPPAAADKVDLTRKVERALEVYEELLEEPDRSVPQYFLKKAECIAIIPGVIKGALGWGGRHGRGVLSCRNGGRWSPPAFLKISGGSVGFQIGGQSTDLVLFFMTERSVRSLLRSKFVLGADASVAAGPAGRSAEATTDAKLQAEIFSYAKSRGLFAGVALEGARLAPAEKLNRDYYGGRLWTDEILFGSRVPNVPPEAKRLMRGLP